MRINYIKGDATRPEGTGNRIICHVCNDVGGWGRGFVVAVSGRWPEPEAQYRAWYAGRDGNDFGLGAAQLVRVEEEIWVANIVGQRGLKRTADGPPVRYEAIEQGLSAVRERAVADGSSVHMPRIGCGLAGGDWSEVERIVERTLLSHSVPVTVYDLG